MFFQSDYLRSDASELSYSRVGASGLLTKKKKNMSLHKYDRIFDLEVKVRSVLAGRSRGC